MIVLMTSQSLETRWTKQQQQTQANSMPADDGAKLGGTSWGSVGIHLTCTSIPTTSLGYTLAASDFYRRAVEGLKRV